MLTFDTEASLLQKGYEAIIGCDEVGRGCLAGPVVACAVNLHSAPSSELESVNDSKLLSPQKRERLTEHIKQNSTWAIGIVEAPEIDEINIHNASLKACQNALTELHTKLNLVDKNKSMLLMDGKFKIPSYMYSQTAIIDGDAKIFSIAAASILAKVYRDALMRELEKQFPGYELAKHKGYGTKVHRAAIQNLGPSNIHRLSFHLG